MLSWSDKQVEALVSAGGGWRSSAVTRKIEPGYKSRIAAAIHETMRGAHEVGVVDKTTMRCSLPVDSRRSVARRYSSVAGEREKASQAVFASYLNVTTNLVSKWERGQKRPSGSALKLLSIVKAKGLEALV